MYAIADAFPAAAQLAYIGDRTFGAPDAEQSAGIEQEWKHFEEASEVRGNEAKTQRWGGTVAAHATLRALNASTSTLPNGF
eukprot:15004474-Alexandrium_andersonii.AAC.1